MNDYCFKLEKGYKKFNKIIAATRKRYEQNAFIQNLLNRVKYPLIENDLKQVIEMYHL